MSYLVLARKWRPRRFEDVVGQGHVVRALTHALDEGRLHHAYLFTGTRGVGKTTLARIFAKSLNCERGVGSRPCGECSACLEVDAGRFVDLIEVDAASRTRVDETRELLDYVQYAPTRGRYKVYLIDEVHMFSSHSFNALLKTLEEPPPHVVFLLATTDPKKLPVTVLSRCLQFHLKPLGEAPIEAHLARIVAAEGVSAEPEALRLIARAADGSVRDALSLLDQAIAFGGGRLTAEEVGGMLGLIDRRQVLDLLERLVARDAMGLLAATAALYEANADFAAVLGELLGLLQRVAIVQVLGAEAEEEERLRALAGRLSEEECQLYYQIGLIGRRDLPLAPDPRSGFEMVLLRMLAFRPAVEGERQGGARGAAGAAQGGGVGALDWERLLRELPVSGLVRELASHCVFRGYEGGRFRLALSPAHAQLRNARCEARLQEALRERLGGALELVIEVEGEVLGNTPAEERRRRAEEAQQALAEAVERDPHLRLLRETFGAVVESVSPRP